MLWKSDTDTDEDTHENYFEDLMIGKEDADLAGTEVDEPPDGIKLAEHAHLLYDKVHHLIMEFLEETELLSADFQLLSLHVFGSLKNLILISPTRSGKTLEMTSLFMIRKFYLSCSINLILGKNIWNVV